MSASAKDFVALAMALKRAREVAAKQYPECDDRIFEVIREFIAAYMERMYPRFNREKFFR